MNENKRQDGYYHVQFQEGIWDICFYHSNKDIWTMCGLDLTFKDNNFVKIIENKISTPGTDNKEWIDIENERFQWSLETFKEATSISSLRKAEKEIEEIEQNILNNVKDPEEYADVLMCIIDSAGREGITLSDILSAYKQKVEINKNRVWIKNPDNSYSHVPKENK